MDEYSEKMAALYEAEEFAILEKNLKYVRGLLV